MADIQYDIVVVGAGMMGSSAAKHIKGLNPLLKVGLVGPLATEVLEENAIHGAHYDEGRVTRMLGSDPIWSTLAIRSIARYREIERQSGIQFYHEVGYMILGKKNEPYLRECRDVANQTHFVHEEMEGNDLGRTFPFLKITDDTQGLYNSEQSGHISPRLFVQAQRRIAKNFGCDIIDDVTKSIHENHGHLVLTTEKGMQYKTKKVLLATGAFIHSRNLLPKDRQPQTELHCATVLLSEIAEKDLPHFSNMPSMFVSQDCPSLKNECIQTGFYILPPIKYPNGKWYLKIGASQGGKQTVKTAKEIDDWYQQRTTDEAVKPLLYKARRNVFKGMRPVAEHFDQCVICMTPSARPYIDMVTPKVGLAVGGCGWAAKSSDEIGLAAARMIIKGSWDHDLPRECFRCSYQSPKSNL